MQNAKTVCIAPSSRLQIDCHLGLTAVL